MNYRAIGIRAPLACAGDISVILPTECEKIIGIRSVQISYMFHSSRQKASERSNKDPFTNIYVGPVILVGIEHSLEHRRHALVLKRMSSLAICAETEMIEKVHGLLG